MRHPKYRITPTTADIGLEVWAESLSVLFVNAAQAILNIMADTQAIGSSVVLDLEVEGRDTEGLMVTWLNEIIFLHEAKELVFTKVEVLQFANLSVKGRLYGEAIDLSRHRLGRLIKGVTYHRLNISQLAEHEWRLQLILDI
jgi:SHS2 domain-containing protein